MPMPTTALNQNATGNFKWPSIPQSGPLIGSNVVNNAQRDLDINDTQAQKAMDYQPGTPGASAGTSNVETDRANFPTAQTTGHAAQLTANSGAQSMADNVAAFNTTGGTDEQTQKAAALSINDATSENNTTNRTNTQTNNGTTKPAITTPSPRAGDSLPAGARDSMNQGQYGGGNPQQTPPAPSGDSSQQGQGQQTNFWDTLLDIAKMTGQGLATIIGNTGLIALGQPSISQVKAGQRQEQILQQNQLDTQRALDANDQYWNNQRQQYQIQLEEALKKADLINDAKQRQEAIDVATQQCNTQFEIAANAQVAAQMAARKAANSSTGSVFNNGRYY
jgi:hypothetical protein